MRIGLVFELPKYHQSSRQVEFQNPTVIKRGRSAARHVLTFDDVQSILINNISQQVYEVLLMEDTVSVTRVFRHNAEMVFNENSQLVICAGVRQRGLNS